MTREEEIKKQADIYTDNASNYAEWSDDGGWSETNDIELIEKAFIEGAKWADEYPNRRLVYTKQELRTMGFGFDLNGNIVTLDEMDEMAKRANEYRKSKLIEKACEWLEDQEEMIGISFEEDFIERFKKAMEE